MTLHNGRLQSSRTFGDAGLVRARVPADTCFFNRQQRYTYSARRTQGVRPGSLKVTESTPPESAPPQDLAFQTINVEQLIAGTALRRLRIVIETRMVLRHVLQRVLHSGEREPTRPRTYVTRLP